MVGGFMKYIQVFVALCTPIIFAASLDSVNTSFTSVVTNSFNTDRPIWKTYHLAFEQTRFMFGCASTVIRLADVNNYDLKRYAGCTVR